MAQTNTDNKDDFPPWDELKVQSWFYLMGPQRQQQLVANCWKTSREHNIIDNRYIGKDRILHYDHEGAETPITVSPQEEEAPFKVVIVGSPNVVRISSRAPFQPTDNLMQ
eukprot:GEZU01026100.1.p2 GENE.GEZU01026100.1~~GEZU01026100.1.p2  ORF type:complete len:110 (+),score=23.72 GEZU01026100.1:580-909(+)